MHESLRDIKNYSTDYIIMGSNGIHIPVTYMKSWNDDFGARGWKLNVTIDDPQIIASTRETGLKINTSVFVHDILDHFLSGFSVSGHRSEAMALTQLSKRTHSDPRPDYEQMIKEDVLNGIINGESLSSFIPDDLKKWLPVNIKDSEIMGYLGKQFTKTELVNIFTEHFFRIGKEGEHHAINNWKALGLEPDKKTEIGEAIQNSLSYIDSEIEILGIEKASAIVSINNDCINFSTKKNAMCEAIISHSTQIC